MNRVRINEAANVLGISEESILILIQHHRIATDVIEGELIARDDDVMYFQDYFSTYGKLPDLIS